MTVSDCPSPEQLDLLLRDEVDAPARVPLELHIADCLDCQRRLVERPQINDWQRLLTDDFISDFTRSPPSAATRSISSSQTDPATSELVPLWPGIPGFEPIRELGRGGSSVVYAARQQNLDRMVAIKLLPESATHLPDRRLRFRNEAKVIAQLQHPGIVQVFDSGEADGRAWIAQEFCDGGTLADRINRTPQQPATAAQIVWQLAQAVQHAHNVGIIHRDIKPDNVLFSADLPRLTDFGLARILDVDTGVTRTADVMGTPSYMAPEQACGDRDAIGTGSDIYALGGVLYEMLTGSPPFLGTTVLDTLRLVLDRDPVAPRQLQPAVPLDLETVCLKCLEKDISRRYASAADLASDLQRFLDGRPTHARPVSTTRRVVKWAKRKPTVAALGGAVLAFAGALLTVWGYLTVRLNDSNDLLKNSNQQLAQRSQELSESTELALQNEEKARANLEQQVATNAALREVLDFFTTDLFDAATSEQRGISLTVLEVLEEADRKINDRSLDRPDVEAALRLAVGNTLSLIGQPQKAVIHLERADELYQELENSSSTAFDCRQSFARCLRSLGKRDQARKLLEDLATERWEPDDLQRLRLQLDLHKYLLEGKPLEAQLAALASTLEESREKLGPGHVITLSFLSAQAETWYRAGKFEEALEVYRQELLENETSLGQNHPNTWNAANNVAVTLIRLQRLPEAEEIHRENLRRQLMFRGPRDVGTMGTKHNLSMVVWRQNKRQEAVDLLREVLVGKTEALGPAESRTLASLYQIGRMYVEMQQFQQGSECFAKHLQPFLESARPTVQWVDLLTVQGQLTTGAGELDTAAVSLAKAKELLAALGDEGFGFQRKTLKSAEDALEAARRK